MKPISIAHRTLFTVLLTGTTVTSTGCSSGGFSLASMNPFSRNVETTGLGATGGPSKAIAKDSSKVGTFKTVSNSAKGAFGKTTNAIAGVFRRNESQQPIAKKKEDSDDPLRLDNVPKEIDPEVFVANGQLWESTGDFPKAMESYTKALEQDGQHAPALTGLARLHFRQGNLNDAVTYFNRAIVRKPNDAGLHNDLGLTMSKLGNQPAAIASLEKALSIAPGTSRYANNLASVRYESGDPSGALSVLMQNNKPAVSHFNMAYLYHKSGKAEQAKSHLAEALKFENKDNADPATGRAIQRSRDMLAQLGGARGPNHVRGPIAQAGPQAKTASRKVASTPSYTAPVQQASRTATPTRPVATTTNSLANAAPTTSISLPTNILATSSPPGPQAQPAPAMRIAATPPQPTRVPKWNSWNPTAAVSTTSGSSPSPIIKPASVKPPSTSVPSPPSASSDPASTPAVSSGFALPKNF